MSIPLYIFTQIDQLYPFWHNGFFYLSVGLIITFFILTWIMMRALRRRTLDNKLTQQQHAAKIDALRKEHGETLEKLRRQMVKREEEHGRLWHESEKEVIGVLNGVSNLLELNEKLGQIDTEKILTELGEIKGKLSNIITKE